MVHGVKLLALALALSVLAPGVGRGQDTQPAEPGSAGAGAAQAPATPGGGIAHIGRESVMRLIQQANPMLWLLVACSVFTFAFVLERALALRRRRVIPKEFGERFLERLSMGKLDRERAIELCKANDSPLARVYGHAVRYWGQPAATIRQALDHDTASEILELKRNIRVLNATATIAPLLGLLGTVIGMIESFEAVGGGRIGQASRSEALAHGISLALVATAFGLAIAVISVAAYYYFLQKVDMLTRELDDHARQVVDLISAEALRYPTHRGPLLGAPNEDGGRVQTRALGRVDTT
jgi:biopolymer transport protein ExbB